MRSCSRRKNEGKRNSLQSCSRMRTSALWLLRRRDSLGDASTRSPRILLVDACTDPPAPSTQSNQSLEYRQGCAWVVALELQELGWGENVAMVSFDSVVVGGTDSPHASASILTHVIAACQREVKAFVYGLHDVTSVVHVLDAASFVQSILRKWKQSGTTSKVHIARVSPSAAAITLKDHISAALSAAALQLCTLETSDVSVAHSLSSATDALKVDVNVVDFIARFEGLQAASTAGREWRMRREDFSNMQPYVSIVLATRVDSHEGNFMQRLQNNIDLMTHMVSLYDVSAELLLVEWNPTNASLMQSITWPTCVTRHHSSSAHDNRSSYVRGCLSIRIVQVPPHVHETMHRSNVFNLFEFKAKNVGIARARGRFVITGTPDSLWDPQIFSWLGRELALEDRLYRACRSSLMLPPPPFNNHCNASSRVSALISYMQSSPVDPSSVPPPIGSCPVCCEGQGGKTGPRTRLHFGCTCGFGMASGDFAMSSKELWHRIGGYPEWSVNFHMDSLLNAKFGSVFGGILETTLQGSVYHQWHPRSSKAGWAEPMDWPVPLCDFICCEGGSSSGSNIADGKDSLCHESWSSSSQEHEHIVSVNFGCSDGPLTNDVWGLEQMQLPECESVTGGIDWICIRHRDK